MHPERFDTLIQELGSLGTRRRALGALIGGALSGLVLTDPKETWSAKSGKCKPKCGECERCKRGDCDKRDGKTRCKKGKCKATQDGIACGSGGVCQAGKCVCLRGTELCGGACRTECPADEGMVRNPFTCACCLHGGGGSANPCDPANNQCCSGNCVLFGGSNICGNPADGTCTFNGQCFNGNCDGGTCF